ncbi:MKK2 [Symbiodinium natans]|uniref:mitogen-activated protein kinase kinase n=1 Tax=Symbiodinium natans TaxID=878477 RepID=A0A812I9E2_9DINO|nr:MKK2 [Symbiodinium natans]
MRVSPDKGVVVDGREYKLSPQDIDLDRDCTLGTGAGGVVQAGVHKPTGMRVAIKTVKVDNKEKREQMLQEIKGLVLAAGCPYLVQWYAGFVGKDTGLVHVVVELMDRGSLADLRRRLAGPVPPDHVACIAAQVLRGLEHLHSRRLLHRDIKPENVLHNSLGQVKLTDFGISKDLTSTAGVAASFVGTANYMSPERALGKVWSAGMVVFELANGQYPYKAKNFLDLYECLCTQPEPRLDTHKFPSALCGFVAQCLKRDDTTRPDAQTLVKHELVASQGAEQIKLLAEWLATSEAQKMAVRCSDAACHGGRCRLGVATYVHVSNDGNTRGSGL